MKVKASAFNYVKKKKQYVLIYNTLYNALVRLSPDEYSVYARFEDTDAELTAQFIENGIWVDAELDEKSRYLACSTAYTLYAPRPLSLTITTTSKCNARCAYCYEKGIQQRDICEGAEEGILRLIRERADNQDVRLVWFGGEPLMNPTFMDRLSERLRMEDIGFSSYLITNGSLLDEEIIHSKLSFWKIRDVQITLDGTEKIYNKRKKYRDPQQGELNRILDAISEMAKQSVFVHIRLNIDYWNRKSILELLKQLDARYASLENVTYYPAFLSGTKKQITEEKKVEFIRQMMRTVSSVSKLTTGTKLYAAPKMNACMSGDPRSFTIDVDGNLYSCEHDVGIECRKIGSIWTSPEEDVRGKTVRFSEECDSCVFLPKCYGGCAAHRLMGDAPCMIEKYMIQAYLSIV